MNLAKLTIIPFILILASCSPKEEKVSIANPASEYCLEKGGTSEIQKDEEGNESSLCHLPDGTVIEEWELFRKEKSLNN